MKKALLGILPHMCAVFSLAALTLCIVDGVNSQMGFVSSSYGRCILLLANAFSVLLTACILLRRDR